MNTSVDSRAVEWLLTNKVTQSFPEDLEVFAKVVEITLKNYSECAYFTNRRVEHWIGELTPEQAKIIVELSFKYCAGFNFMSAQPRELVNQVATEYYRANVAARTAPETDFDEASLFMLASQQFELELGSKAEYSEHDRLCEIYC